MSSGGGGGGGGLVTKLSPTLATPWTVAHQASLSMDFSRQEYWSVLPFPSSRDPSDPGIEPGSPALNWATKEAQKSVILVYFLTFSFWLHCMAYGILVPWPGVMAVKALSPNHWTARECPYFSLFLNKDILNLSLLNFSELVFILIPHLVLQLKCTFPQQSLLNPTNCLVLSREIFSTLRMFPSPLKTGYFYRDYSSS